MSSCVHEVMRQDKPESGYHLSGLEVPTSRIQHLNSKRIRRLWREEGLVCKPKRRKKRRTGPDAGEQKRLTAEYPMHVLSFDFQSDVTSCGRHIRFFNVIVNAN